MTVSTTNRKNDFSTNGVTVDFPFTFAVTDSEQVKALTVDSEGLEADYINFTISLNTATAGGTLTTGDVLDGVTLIVYRLTQLTQNTDYVGGGRFPADSHEQALDKLTLQNQDQQEEIDRALKYDIGTNISDVLSLSDYDETVNARDEVTLKSANDYTDNQVIEAGAITPNNINMFAGGKPNLLSNHNFLIPSPDDVTPPSATPTTYPAGTQIFSGVFANDTTGIADLTYIDGRVSFSGGDFHMAVPNTGALENITEFVASVADFDGKPRTRGVSYALVGDEYRVTVGIDALEDESANETLLGSVKFEQGSVATGHDIEGAKGVDYTFNTVAEMVATGAPIGVKVTWLGYYSANDGGGSSGVVKYGVHTDDGGSIFSIGANNYIESDIKTESINVLKFGIDDGTNGGDPAIRLNKLIAYLKTAKQNKVKFNKGVSYPFSSRWDIDTPCIIDLRGATLTKTASNFDMIYGANIGAGEVEFLNGTIDGQNITQTFIHLLRFDDENADLSFKNMTIKNNLQQTLGVPDQDIDSDGVYVFKARRLKVENSKVSGISRNGISVIDWCPIQIYKDNEFFDCYLYGVDAEPNNETGIIYNHITFDNNDFVRCGPQGAGNYVWDFGGGAQVLSRNSVQIARQVTVVNNRVDMTVSSMTNGAPVDGIRIDDTITTQYANNEFKNCKVLVNAGGRTTGETATFSGNTFTEANLAVFKIRQIEGDTNPMAGSKASLVLDTFGTGDQNLIRWDGSIQNGGNSSTVVLAQFASDNGKVKLSVSDSRTTNFPQSVVKHKGKVEFDLKCIGAFPLIVYGVDVGNIKFKGGEIDGAIDFVGSGSERLDGLDIDGLKANLTGHFIQGLTAGNNGAVRVVNCDVVATQFIEGRTFNDAIIKGNDYDGAAFYGEQAPSSLTVIRDNNIKNASTRSITSFSTNSAIGGNYSFSSAAYTISAASDVGDNITK